MSLKIAIKNLVNYAQTSQSYALPISLRMIVMIIKILDKLRVLNFFISIIKAQLDKSQINKSEEQFVFNQDIVEVLTFRCHQEIFTKHVKTWSKKRKISVLVPAFNPDTMSAGFFGVFYLAKALAINGYSVTCNLIDSFLPDEKALRILFSKTQGLEDFYKYVKIIYTGGRRNFLIEKQELFVATVWYTAYIAKKLADANGTKFIYLIQDYEAAFHPNNSISVLAHETYNWNSKRLISSESLASELSKKFPEYLDSKKDIFIFNNTLNSVSLDNSDINRLKSRLKNTIERRCLIYFRPEVNRNAHLLIYLVLQELINRKSFEQNGKVWKFYGVGLSESLVQLPKGVFFGSIPRMNPKEYAESLKEYDLGISFMISAHPSLPPLELAKAGVPVLTNTYGEKNESYFKKKSSLIFCGEPNVISLADTASRAIKASDDIGLRVNSKMTHDSVMNEVFYSDDFKEFINA